MATSKPAAAAEAAPKNSKKMLFIIVGVVLLLVIGAGGAFVMMKKNAHDENADDPDAEAVEHDAKPKKKTSKGEKGKPPTFVPMEAFTVNLQPGDDGAEQYLQVVVNFRAEDAQVGEEIKSYTPEIRHRILMLLAGKKAADVAGVASREALAGEICAESNAALGYEASKPKRGAKTEEPAGCGNGPIQAVLFTSFMVQ
ncbi:flagellar basal body-associated FliL family protein [Niveibacterium sp. SC-1]|uniref:flagellar basal body-associated FliL family protein n=1 Tax=Niveibacterium sp. SC-1 TaxID=3135646 RepID=UPI00311E9A80